jgi:hypothetical protein
MKWSALLFLQEFADVFRTVAARSCCQRELCYMLNMNAKRRRPGATETFSVSVDADTKRALRRLADAEFEGNLSALVTDFAEEARRRMAAAAYLRKNGIARLTQSEAETLEAQIEREITKASPRRTRRRVA